LIAPSPRSLILVVNPLHIRPTHLKLNPHNSTSNSNTTPNLPLITFHHHHKPHPYFLPLREKKEKQKKKGRKMAVVDIQTFAQTQLSLLASELAAEIAESSALVSLHSPTALQRAGVALTNLTVTAQRTGLGGKTVLELGPDPATSTSTSTTSSSGSGGGAGELPEHGIRTGDIVLVAEQPSAQARKREVKELEEKGVKGVVTRVGRGFVAVAVEEREGSGGGGGGGGNNELEVGEKRVWIVKVADDVTFRR
jgi:DNA polymerase alpha-associated DNA helicase A